MGHGALTYVAGVAGVCTCQRARVGAGKSALSTIWGVWAGNCKEKAEKAGVGEIYTFLGAAGGAELRMRRPRRRVGRRPL